MPTGTKVGICTNLPENCQKAAAKERQTAPVGKFVCPECNFPLRELPVKRPLPWLWIASGIVGLSILGGGYLAYQRLVAPSEVACPGEKLEEFLNRGPSPDQLLQAGNACRSSVKTASDAELVALAARLCRAAADAGNAEGALCLGQLYDPKDLKPGRLGQMPSADFGVAFDNYRRAVKLGNTEASAKLAELKTFVEGKAREGDRQAAQLLDRWPQ